ncbi:MAG: glucose/galactose MFS transporter [Marinilabiliaceae bacterium]|nr:glucose/galactose MFS transporter [Marinilabiliaceae bacterium]
MNTHNKSGKWNSYILPMIIIGIMFSVLGFAVGINAFFVPFVKAAFHISTAKSYLVTTATFSAFMLFGIPSGKILMIAGYKRSMFFSFLLMALGMLLIVPASIWISFPVFLFALFINGMGQTLLNTAVNPYITILGSEKSAAKRISIMGTCNKLSFGLAPVVLAIFMDTVNIQLSDAIIPFYVITGILVLLGILSYFAPLPEVKATGEDDSTETKSDYTNSKTSILQFPHLLLGALSIFLYVGVENIALVSINDYAIELGLPSPEKFAVYVSVGYILGYFLGIILIPKIVSQTNALKINAALGIISSMCIVVLPGGMSIYFVALLGLANSLLWPAIWPLALAGLGKFTKKGSSLMVMGIAGGGLLPPVLGLLKDYFTSYQQAYWMLLPIYMYFLFYAVKGHKIRIV